MPNMKDTLPRWEYLELRETTETPVEDKLNALGKAGWELVAAIACSCVGGYPYRDVREKHFYLKRQVV